MKKIFVIIISVILLSGINVYAVDVTENSSQKLECNSLIGTSTKTGQIINDVYDFMKFAVPLVLLAMSVKDFGSAIIGQEQDRMKKALKNLYTRLIIAILILVLPTILRYIFKLLGIDTCIL